jgi:hypothetical protein
MVAWITLLDIESYEVIRSHRVVEATGTLRSRTRLILTVKDRFGTEHPGSPITTAWIEFGSDQPGSARVIDSGEVSEINASFSPDDFHIFWHALQKDHVFISLDVDENSRITLFSLYFGQPTAPAPENPRERLEVLQRRFDSTAGSDSPPNY